MLCWPTVVTAAPRASVLVMTSRPTHTAINIPVSNEKQPPPESPTDEGVSPRMWSFLSGVVEAMLSMDTGRGRGIMACWVLQLTEVHGDKEHPHTYRPWETEVGYSWHGAELPKSR